jgi:5-formyltetrahydrofolate cyclo-ligase
MASQADLTPTKLALRRTVKAQRRERTETERDDVTASIAAVALEFPRLRRAQCATAYASLPDEPGTSLLRAGLRELGIRVLLPIVRTRESTEPPEPRLDWAEDTGELRPGSMLAVAEPQGPRLGGAEIGKAQVLLVPALAVDTIGTRLGRGGGYYDNALTQAHPEALILALVHDDEELNVESTPIPREGHDAAVHGVITPTRWMLFR